MTPARLFMPIFAVAAIVIASVAAIPGNVLPVLAGMLADHHALDPGDLGLLVGTGTAAGLATSLTAPHWIGRVDLRRAVGLALVFDSLALLGLWFAPTRPALFAAQALSGAAGIVVASGALTVIARLPNPARAYGIKITTDVVLAGAFLAFFPAARLGLAGFVATLAALCIVVLPLAIRLPAAVPARVRLDGSPARLRDAPFAAWLILACIVVFYVGGMGVWAFIERLAVHAGIAQSAASRAIAAGLIVGVVGSIGAAVLAGRTLRLWPEAASGMLLIASFALLIEVGGTAQFYAALFVMNVSWNFFVPFVIGLIARRDDTGRLASLVPGTVMFGGIVGPVLTGAVIHSFGYHVAIAAMTVVVAVSIAGYVVIARGSRVRRAER